MNYYFDKWNKEATETISASLDLFLKLTEYSRIFLRYTYGLVYV